MKKGWIDLIFSMEWQIYCVYKFKSMGITGDENEI